MSETKWKPEGAHTLIPHLVVRDAEKALEYYQKAFGAEQLDICMRTPDGQKIAHAEFKIGDSLLMICDEFPEWGSQSPQALNGSPVTLSIYVEDVDAVFNRAVEAGATAKMPPADMFWGDRYCKLVDPFGHNWSVMTHIEDVSPEEMQVRAAKAFSEPCPGQEAQKASATEA
jgi:PhnB protein